MVNEIGSTPNLLSHSAQRYSLPTPPPPVQRGDATKFKQPENVQAALLSLPGRAASTRAQEFETQAEAAVEIRQARMGLKKLDGVLADIQANLTRIVKQYPPYGADNPDRIQLLNQVSGLRKQLEALEFPDARPHPGLPEAVYPDRAEVLPPKLDTGSASDDEVKSALDFVLKARNTVANMDEKMWQDVMAFVSRPSEAQAQREMARLHRNLSSSAPNGIGLDQQSIQTLA